MIPTSRIKCCLFVLSLSATRVFKTSFICFLFFALYVTQFGKMTKKKTFRDIDQCENKSTRGRAFQRTASIALRACHGVLDLWPLRALMQHLHICYLGRRSVCKLGSKQGFYIPGST